VNNNSAVRLEDRLALQELVQAYAHFVDRREFDSLVLLFSPDAILAGYDGDPLGKEPLYQRHGRDQIKEAMHGLLRYESTHHMLGQHMIAFDSDDSSIARGELYCNAQHRYSKGTSAWNRAMMIRYLDLYRRTEDVWHIAERRLAIEWVDIHPIGKSDE